MQLLIKKIRLLFVTPLVFIILGGCGGEPEDPKAKIKAMIDLVEVAAEKSSVTLFSEHISEQYQDQHHGNRQRVMRSLLGYFHRNKNIHLFMRIRNIEINEQNPDSAKASVNVAMTGTQVDSAEKLLLLRARVYRFDIDLGYEDDQWMIRAATWQRIQVKDFLD
ncbi:MAG: hypothetical protein HKP55_06855 [Gammaproteobacteria bacterium]|nr:hypothetical protein [Gammaproteobacteria bacterium]